MGFKDYQYKRPDMTALRNKFDELIKTFEAAPNAAEQSRLLADINQLRNDVETMFKLVQIRYSIDTTDKFYEVENNYVDESMPLYEGMVSDYYKALIASPYREALEAEWGAQLFALAECQLKTFSPKVLELLQKENKICSEYRKLTSSAEVTFRDKRYNLQQMAPFMQSPDREFRREAQLSYTKFFEDNEAQIDRIYDDLVKLRTTIAQKLGFDSFVELGYARLGRVDYDAAMVAGYRQQVLESLVPLATQFKEQQRDRLGVEQLIYYDEPLNFLSGNPTPKGSAEQLVDLAQQMYREMSPQTGQFFDYMKDNALLDLHAKRGKSAGGYCEFINNYKSPFIFANFNGTSDDVDTLTHEAGHAFQVYSSRDYELPEYVWPTLEACEIHSMSMEFLAWPWMENFFKEDTAKYKYNHLAGAITFIPYGVVVDEFQHYVYQNPSVSPERRRAQWRAIEQKYLPHRDYAGNKFLERGGFWFRQSHIFYNPFYYIDYTLAQVSALQFWHKAQCDRATAWQDYLRLCQAGGSMSYLELLQLANLKNPFVDGAIKTVVAPVAKWLSETETPS